MSKQLLRENIIVKREEIKSLPINESKKIIESNGKQYKCVAAYRVPISRYDYMNENGRIYSKKLWENVITKQENIWSGSIGLTNHPQNEGDVRDIFCIFHNLGLNEKEKVVEADMYLVGPHGRLANEVIAAGSKIGLSSSGFGEFLEDDQTVNPDTYEIQRISDWVENPSQNVYATKDNEIKQTNLESSQKQENIKEITVEKIENKQLSDTNVTNKIMDTNIVKENNKENNIMSDKFEEKRSLLEKKNFEARIKDMLSGASNKESIKEKIKVFEEVIEYCDDLDFAKPYVEQAQKSIAELNEELHALAEKAKEVDSLKEAEEKVKEENKSMQEKFNDLETAHKELEESTKELSEKYETAKALLEDMKTYTNKLKEMYEIAVAEKNSMVEASEYKELSVYCESIEKKLKEMQRQTKKIVRRPVRQEESIETEDDTPKIFESKSKMFDDGQDYSMSFRDVDTVQEFYNDLLNRNSKVEKIKDLILNCKTLMEAENAWLKYRDLVEDIPEAYRGDGIDDNDFYRQSGTSIRKAPKQESSFKNRMVREGWM